MKVCSKCKVEKKFSEFYRDKCSSNRYHSSCKECDKQYLKEYRKNNKETANKYAKQYRLDNKSKVKEQNKLYQSDNKEKINLQRRIYRNNRRLNDPLYKLICNTRDLIRKSVKKQGYSKTSRTYEILGCTFEEFKIHIEQQFTEGMTWNNYAKWELDHIYPVSRAIDEDHLIKLNHYTNFQPLWWWDNNIKSNKI